jgi:hypothetical protein
MREDESRKINLNLIFCKTPNALVIWLALMNTFSSEFMMNIDRIFRYFHIWDIKIFFGTELKIILIYDVRASSENLIFQSLNVFSSSTSKENVAENIWRERSIASSIFFYSDKIHFTPRKWRALISKFNYIFVCSAIFLPNFISTTFFRCTLYTFIIIRLQAFLFSFDSSNI